MNNIFLTRPSVLVVGLMFIFAAGGLTSMAQDPSLIGGVGITLFDRANFNGQAVTFRENVPNLANRGFNNRAQSLRVGAGEQWEVCDLANYRGQCIVVSGEENNLNRNAWNNRISSLRRVGVGTPPDTDGYIVLFTGLRYTGSPTNYNSARAIIQKSARSVTIGRGTWQICDGMRYTGRCVTLTESVPNLNSYNIGRTIRSVRPAGIVPLPTPVPPVANPYMVLFDRVNYRGVRTNYYRSQANIAKTARSASVSRGTWEICDGRNFSGRCITLTESVSNLNSYNIGRIIRSVRPAGIVQPTPVPPVANPYMVLYDRVNYRGVRTNYYRSQASIAKTARSATVSRGTWEICDGRNFTGRCQTLRQSAPDLRTYNIGLVIRSVRPVNPEPR